MPPARAAPRLVGRSCAELERTSLSPQALPQNLPPVQGVASCRPEKPDRYWSAPRGAKRPLISTTEIGYVRRSEIICGGLLRTLRPHTSATTLSYSTMRPRRPSGRRPPVMGANGCKQGPPDYKGNPTPVGRQNYVENFQ